MKAVFYTGDPGSWLPKSAEAPWGLLPVANRPLLEYWVEFALALGVEEVRLLLGEGAYEVERMAGEGAQWGVSIVYAFVRPGHGPEEYLRRKRAEWGEGLLYFGGGDFPRRLGEEALRGPEPGEWCRWGEGAFPDGFLCTDAAGCAFVLEGEGAAPPRVEPASLGWTPEPLREAAAYFRLNMELAAGEIRRYVTPGYGFSDESHIGYNVLTPPSCTLRPPVLIGNDVRLRPLSEVGPRAVVGNHVVVDGQTVVRNCVVLDGTYVGQHLELDGKIVCGGTMVDPESGEALELEDPLLLDGRRRYWRLGDALQILAGKGVALGFWLAGLPVFVLGYGWIRLRGDGRFRRVEVPDRLDRSLSLPVFRAARRSMAVRGFEALSLDRWPAVGRVLRDRLYLCGHLPIDPVREPGGREDLADYLPAAFSEELRMEDPSPQQRAVIRRWAAHHRSPLGDLRTLTGVWVGRLLSFFTSNPGSVDHA